MIFGRRKSAYEFIGYKKTTSYTKQFEDPNVALSRQMKPGLRLVFT